MKHIVHLHVRAVAILVCSCATLLAQAPLKPTLPAQKDPFLRERGGTQTPPQPARSFNMPDLTVYPSNSVRRAKTRAMNLSPREVAILSLLHERAGQTVDRDTLLNRCWGVDYFPDSRTLDQHIAKLRKRIEIDPQEPLIVETVRGVGDRFRAREA